MTIACRHLLRFSDLTISSGQASSTAKFSRFGQNAPFTRSLSQLATRQVSERHYHGPLPDYCHKRISSRTNLLVQGYRLVRGSWGWDGDAGIMSGFNNQHWYRYSVLYMMYFVWWCIRLCRPTHIDLSAHFHLFYGLLWFRPWWFRPRIWWFRPRTWWFRPRPWWIRPLADLRWLSDENRQGPTNR